MIETRKIKGVVSSNHTIRQDCTIDNQDLQNLIILLKIKMSISKSLSFIKILRK